MMKINVGVTNMQGLEIAISGGASEVYCGVLGISNHRPADARYNFRSTRELKEAINEAHSGRLKIYLLANELYLDSQILSFLPYIRKAMEFGIDGLIVRDISLMQALREEWPSIPLVLSSLAVVFNVSALRWFQRFKISRVVLPQHILPPDVSLMKKQCNLKMEIFFRKEEYCKNTDGLCFFHDPGKFNSIKKEYLRSESLLKVGKKPMTPLTFKEYPCLQTFIMQERKKLDLGRINLYLKSSFLGDLYDMHKAGVEYLKIKRFKAEKLKKELKSALIISRLLEKSVSKNVFMRNAVLAEEL